MLLKYISQYEKREATLRKALAKPPPAKPTPAAGVPQSAEDVDSASEITKEAAKKEQLQAAAALLQGHARRSLPSRERELSESDKQPAAGGGAGGRTRTAEQQDGVNLIRVGARFSVQFLLLQHAQTVFNRCDPDEGE